MRYKRCRYTGIPVALGAAAALLALLSTRASAATFRFEAGISDNGTISFPSGITADPGSSVNVGIYLVEDPEEAASSIAVGGVDSADFRIEDLNPLLENADFTSLTLSPGTSFFANTTVTPERATAVANYSSAFGGTPPTGSDVGSLRVVLLATLQIAVPDPTEAVTTISITQGLTDTSENNSVSVNGSIVNVLPDTFVVAIPSPAAATGGLVMFGCLATRRRFIS